MTTPTTAHDVLGHFSTARVLADLATLAEARFAGRRVGTTSHDLARDWVVERMAGLALHPTTFPFTLTTPVVEVYAPVQLDVPGMALQRRRDFCEHPRSADDGRPQAGVVVPWSAPSGAWNAHWVRLAEDLRGPALTAVAEQVQQGGGRGLLLPQVANQDGYLVKRVVMGEPVALPVLAVRADLLPTLDGQIISAATPVRPQYAQGALVIGQRDGSDDTLANAPLLVGAHYDGVGADAGGPHFPCATDNAVGVAIVLEVARLLSAYPVRRPIHFVAFDAEEVNAQGSQAYAHHLAAQGTTPTVVNLDGVATWRGHLLVELGQGSEALVPVLDAVGRELAIPLDQAVISSDQRRFTGAGFPAVGISAGLAGMHTPADTVTQITAAAVRYTGSFLLAALLRLAA